MQVMKGKVPALVHVHYIGTLIEDLFDLLVRYMLSISLHKSKVIQSITKV
jgi:hypothetical protein